MVPVADMPYSSVAHLVGNGMHVASAGLILILVALFVQKI